MIAAAQLPLFDEPLLYHELGGRAYFGALVRGGGGDGRMQHDCYPVEHLPYWLKSIDRGRDSYVSQGQFSRAQRRIAALLSIGLSWADLGDDGELGRYGDAVAVTRSLQAIDEAGIPAPSLIINSGRGYHAKWLFERSVPWQALDRWSIVERTIAARLQGLGADLKATDATRVLRVIGTVNSRTGTIARLVWSNDVDGVPLRYGFDALADEVLPILRLSHHERRGEVRVGTEGARAGARGASHYTVGSLWWGRYRDIRRLCALRGWSAPYGGVPEGYRDQVLFLGSVALSWLALPATWWGEVQSLAAELTPSLRKNEWQTYVGTAHRRLLASVGDGKQEQRYRYSTARIVCDLGISREEMASLEMLVSPEIAHARKLENDQKRVQEVRRARGVVPRDDYLKQTADRTAARAQEVQRLSAEGLSGPQIAKRLGVNQSTISRILARNAGYA